MGDELPESARRALVESLRHENKTADSLLQEWAHEAGWATGHGDTLPELVVGLRAEWRESVGRMRDQDVERAAKRMTREIVQDALSGLRSHVRALEAERERLRTSLAAAICNCGPGDYATDPKEHSEFCPYALAALDAQEGEG